MNVGIVDSTRAILERQLLAIGGSRVTGMVDPDMAAIVERGALVAFKSIKKVSGMAIRCHTNVASRYVSEWEKGLEIAAGYALKEDCWRSHSWLWYPQRQIIVETTVKAEAYFGIVLSDLEALDFVYSNGLTKLPGYGSAEHQARSLASSCDCGVPA